MASERSGSGRDNSQPATRTRLIRSAELSIEGRRVPLLGLSLGEVAIAFRRPKPAK